MLVSPWEPPPLCLTVFLSKQLTLVWRCFCELVPGSRTNVLSLTSSSCFCLPDLPFHIPFQTYFY